MKKLLAIVLLLCLVCTSAFAAGNLERTETRVVREKKDYDESYGIHVYIQLKNTGDAPISVEGNYDLLDASGNDFLRSLPEDIPDSGTRQTVPTLWQW